MNEPTEQEKAAAWAELVEVAMIPRPKEVDISRCAVAGCEAVVSYGIDKAAFCRYHFLEKLQDLIEVKEKVKA